MEIVIVVVIVSVKIADVKYLNTIIIQWSHGN
jgi:hypothetical protein